MVFTKGKRQSKIYENMYISVFRLLFFGEVAIINIARV